MLRSVGLAGLLVVTLALPACGTSGDEAAREADGTADTTTTTAASEEPATGSQPATTAAPEKPRFVREADRICRDASDKEAQVGVLTSDPASLRNFGSRILEIRKDKAVALAEVNVPSNKTAAWENLMDVMNQTYAALGKAIASARNGNSPDMTEVQQLGSALGATSLQFGFTWCP